MFEKVEKLGHIVWDFIKFKCCKVWEVLPWKVDKDMDQT